MRLFLIAAAVLSAQPADSVLVVVNQNSPLSKTIGEYYARKRSIPQTNVCAIDAPQDETVGRAAYTQVERAVAACLRSGNLVEKVLYIVTTSGVPLRVEGTSEGMGSDAASVDSELTLLYGKLHGQRFGLNGMTPNPFFNRSDAKFAHPEFPIYLVTRLAAYDFPGVRGLIDRALQARNTGKFVLDARSGSDDTGDGWLRDAAIRLPADRTVHDETASVLYGQKDVVGFASWGSNDRNRRERRLRFTWLPGAIMTEFVSTNARTFVRPPNDWKLGKWEDKTTWFGGSPQTLIGDYIEDGVTGVAGHVYEPFLSLSPRPQLLLPAWHSGRNLAESFYLSIPGLSWQNVVIGDPLCSLGPPSARR